MGTTHHAAPKTVNLMHKCKKCKRAVRTTCTIETKVYDNEHPEWYLRKRFHYTRIVGTEHWYESRYFRFPWANCPGCGFPREGKPIEGRLVPDHPCDRRCTGATGHSCECSCGGANHGMDHAASPA